MNIGLIAVATKTGLGYQTRGFYKHLKPSKVLLVDISELNHQEQFYGWYEEYQLSKGFPTKNAIQSFLTGLDVVLTCETPYNYELFTIARKMGVKTVNQINPEFFDYFRHNYPVPDMFINPSTWKHKEIENWSNQNKVQLKQIHYPVDREQFRYKQRTTKTIFHIAGKQAAHDRNGTYSFMHVRPNGTVLTQTETLATQLRSRYRHSKVWTNISNPESMYNFGDVLIFPRKYGGNCLPMNEALSCGVPVIMTDISPNNTFLPKEWLVPAFHAGQFEPRAKVDIFEAEPMGLAQKIDEIIERWDIVEESEKANKIAESISWEALKPVYMKTFEELCES